MKIHLIAIGGAAMHNIALALHQNGHQVTGSDDEIYNPAKDRLAKAGLLPDTEGWFAERITADLDCVILGMHARKDNPELARAQELGITIYSYPQFIYEHAKHKKRVVIAGSHGKTTTTAMIMHVLKHAKCDFDYLVGALLDGFDTMVRLSDAPIMVIEGDEYLSSPIDLVPKMHHYKPHIAVITGIAWDHINVFPTFEGYVEQFRLFTHTIEKGGVVYYDATDAQLTSLDFNKNIQNIGYQAFPSVVKKGKTHLVTEGEQLIALQIFGEHNLKNIQAAYLVCRTIGVSDVVFWEAISSFSGAAKRLQILRQSATSMTYLDFAHAPSKVRATVKAVKAHYPKRRLVACLELHTFSSLNKNFLPHYAHSLQGADEAIVYFNEHTLAMKKMPPLSIEEVAAHFQHPNIRVFTDNQALSQRLSAIDFRNVNLLLMTSGTFNGLDLKTLGQ